LYVAPDCHLGINPMAKSRRVAPNPDVANRDFSSRKTLLSGEARLLTPDTGARIVAAMIGAAIVYVAYWPSDSTEVSAGAARYLVAWLIAAAAIAIASFGPVRRADRWIDSLAFCFAGWMTCSLVFNASDANVRLGINELGWWIAIAALIFVGRRVAATVSFSHAMLHLFAVTSLGVALCGWHQLFIGFPQMIAEYQADPEATLRQLGIQAEEGSAMRVVFENRLYDGGPTGTFALANSMAVMLVGGWVAMIGLLWIAWRDINFFKRLMWVVGITVVGGMILASRSRSAVLSLLLLAAVVALRAIIIRRHRIPILRDHFRWAIAATGLLTLGASVGVYMLRNAEWIQQAPASLVIRFHYWLASFKMVGNHPWLGVGPGQFKSRYEAFRSPTSIEQIADPHQFLIQTLTAGGVPALALLMLLLLGLVWLHWLRTERGDGELGFKDDQAMGVSPSVQALFIGGGIAIAGYFLVGSGLVNLFSLDPYVFATALSGGFAFMLWTGKSSPSEVGTVARDRDLGETNDLRIIGRCAAATMAIALLTSGGMTVPGISIMMWMMAAIGSPIGYVAADPSSRFASFRQRPVLVAGGILLVIWYVLGIAPIERTRVLENRSTELLSLGQIEPAIVAMEESAKADVWNPEPWLLQVSVASSLAISQPPLREPWEKRWLIAEQEAVHRAPQDPVLRRQLGDQWLWHFQRYGEPLALERARTLFADAVRLSPSHEAYAAQLAAITREMNDDQAAIRFAGRAEELSQLGGYYERTLGFIMIAPVKMLGEQATAGLVRRPASEVLEELLAQSSSTSR
jgi:hypothetical protein